MVELVERRTGISRGEILGPRRVLEVIKARHLLWGLAYICAPHLSVAQIGRLSNRDHTTILHGFRKGREHPLYEELKAELLSRLPIEPLAREKGE
jgi:chromosomal replication initiation ATPase DnaA